MSTKFTVYDCSIVYGGADVRMVGRQDPSAKFQRAFVNQQRIFMSTQGTVCVLRDRPWAPLAPPSSSESTDDIATAIFSRRCSAKGNCSKQQQLASDGPSRNRLLLKRRKERPSSITFSCGPIFDSSSCARGMPP